MTVTRRRSTEAGMTLIETIVAIALMTLAVVGIVGGMATTEKVTAAAQGDAQTQAALRSVVDQLRSSIAYAPCDSASGTAYWTAVIKPSGYNLTLNVMRPDPTKVRWGSTAQNPVPLATPRVDCTINQNYPPTCTSGHICDYGIQRITVTLVQAGRQTLRQVMFKGATT